MIEVEVCLFNSLHNYAPQWKGFRMNLVQGSRVADIVRKLRIPEHEIYVAFRNGKNIMAELGKHLEGDTPLADGDRIALSGPVPFSRGYGAPVV